MKSGLPIFFSVPKGVIELDLLLYTNLLNWLYFEKSMRILWVPTFISEITSNSLFLFFGVDITFAYSETFLKIYSRTYILILQLVYLIKYMIFIQLQSKSLFI